MRSKILIFDSQFIQIFQHIQLKLISCVITSTANLIPTAPPIPKTFFIM